MIRRSLVPLWAAVLTGAPTTLTAATLRVPGDYPSVLSAVDAAASGDSVVVGPGTWTHTDTRVIWGQPATSHAFLKPGIAVVSTDGPLATALSGDPYSEVFLHASSGPEPILVSGFTATGGIGLTAGAVAPMDVRSCRLVNNRHDGAAVIGQASVTFRDCEFSGNSWDFTHTFDIYAYQAAALELYDCTIRDNLGRRGIFVDEVPRVILDGCTLSGHLNTGASSFYDVADLQVRNSTFAHNRSVAQGGSSGAGLYALNSFGVIEFCAFVDDSATWSGGVGISGGLFRINNNTFYNCKGLVSTALHVAANDGGTYNNIFAFCESTYGVVRRTRGPNAPETGCNIFFANTGGDFTGDPYTNAWTPSPTDVFADPQLCDAPNDDWTLRTSSPGAPGNTPTGGSIGAMGVGCSALSIRESSWGRIKGLYHDGGER